MHYTCTETNLLTQIHCMIRKNYFSSAMFIPPCSVTMQGCVIKTKAMHVCTAVDGIQRKLVTIYKVYGKKVNVMWNNCCIWTIVNRSHCVETLKGEVHHPGQNSWARKILSFQSLFKSTIWSSLVTSANPPDSTLSWVDLTSLLRYNGNGLYKVQPGFQPWPCPLM